MRHIWWTFVAIVLVFLVAGFIDLPQTSNVMGHKVQINKGIDLAGGVRLLLCANKGQTVTSGAMDTARNVIENRASGGIGAVEPQVSRVGSRCVSAELPGVKNTKNAIATIGKTGYLAITDSSSKFVGTGTRVKLVCPSSTPKCAPRASVGATNMNAKIPVMQVVVPGSAISQGSAQVSPDATTGQPTVTYTMTGSGSNAWCNFTTNHVNQYSGIVLDNKVVSDPQIRQAICGGQTQITGITSMSEAQQIATYLNYGALPVAMSINSSQVVAASLGPIYVNQALKAGVIGLIIVALFMLLYYRLPGLLADVALVLYAAVVLALFKVLGITMTLAGIAGFILSIGMAVDANVLIFERMREELRAGKTLGAAVESGFSRAWPSIRDSNLSTIITTIILFWFGHNFAATTITGFATTLFIGVVTSFITAYFVSKTFLRLVVLSGGLREPQLYGVEQAAGGRVA
jgi:preprotein translocase subunit SecD